MNIYCIYILVNAVFPAVILMLSRRFNKILSMRYILYLAVVIAGGFLINLSLLMAYKLFTGGEMPCIEPSNYIFYYLFLFIPFAFVSGAFSKTILAITFYEACLIGVIMGLINTYETSEKLACSEGMIEIVLMGMV